MNWVPHFSPVPGEVGIFRSSVEPQKLARCPLVHFHRAPRLVPGVADVLQRTLRALRLARDAQLPSVPDDLVGKENPALSWDDLHQILLDLLRVVLLRQFQSPR